MDRLRREQEPAATEPVQQKRDRRAAPAQNPEDEAAQRNRRQPQNETAGSPDSGAAGPAEGAGAWHADDALNSALGVDAGEPEAGDGASAAGGVEQTAGEAAGEGAAAGGGQRAGTRPKPSAVQKKSLAGSADATANVHAAAEAGISGPSSSLPHLDAIQQSFGDHDVSGVQAHVGGAAAQASNAMGAEAYATGNHVAFGSSSPSMHTAAHEAAHVVQQRGGVHLKGGVGEAGDAYEQHADAVADRVVQGQSAVDLLDGMAGPSSAGGGGVQRKVVQMDIKSDLRTAMDGWGTDEDAIYQRLERATIPELQAVIRDPRLMAELRDELNQSEMERVLDLLRAPLADKLRLAMEGWGADSEYIQSAIRRATPDDLTAVSRDAALVNQLESELPAPLLRVVLDQLNVPLRRKLEYAIRGWGTDEQYIFDSCARASVADLNAVVSDRGFFRLVEDDLNAEERARFRAEIAHRIEDAFSVISDPSRAVRTTRLTAYGDQAAQRLLLDTVIIAAADLAVIQQAFESYWDVDLAADADTAGWDLPTLRRVHAQLKLLPAQDVRSGVWKRLVLEDGSGGSMDDAGEFRLGDEAHGTDPDAPDQILMGVGTRLGAAVSAGATSITVTDPSIFDRGDTIVLRPQSNRDVARVASKTDTGYQLEGGLAKDHPEGAVVTTDDPSAMRRVTWIDAVVRHEIAHSVDTAIGGVRGFTEGLGGWWTGDSFDSWASAMGNPWQTSDSSSITDDEKRQIKEHIDSLRDSGGGAEINDGLAADHPINKYLDKNVPVIEAAKPCVRSGDDYWHNPEVVKKFGSKRFAINFYYGVYQYYNEIVHTRRVRNYAVYSPAEFFAEVYTVYYEEAGRVPEDQLGARVPVGDWRQWITDNVHNRGHAPTAAPGASPAPPGPAGAGRSAGNPG